METLERDMATFIQTCEQWNKPDRKSHFVDAKVGDRITAIELCDGHNVFEVVEVRPRKVVAKALTSQNVVEGELYTFPKRYSSMFGTVDRQEQLFLYHKP